MIDSHCHLDSPEFVGDEAGVLDRAAAAGVDGIVAIGGGAAPGTLAHNLNWLDRFAGAARCWATVGIHPHEAALAEPASFDELAGLAADRRVIAIGEIGLDYHYDHSPREVQRRVFERQLSLAGDIGLPVSIHCRDAFDDCFAGLDLFPAVRGVFHCFTGDTGQAARALDRGWRLSFSGMLTFPKVEFLRQAAVNVPAEMVLVETDAPYLAPVPHRGRRNEPAWVVETAAALARLRGWSGEEAAARLEANFFHAFPRAAAGQ